MSHRRIYLVRHGLTIANEAGVVQTPEDTLHEIGVAQAHTLAHRFSLIPFDSLLSSDLPRAVHTAEIIGQKTGHPLATTPLLRESGYPSEFFGKSRYGDEVLAYYREKENHLDDYDYRYGDEESFNMLRERAKQALHFLYQQKGTLAVVSHGFFIRKMVYQVLFGDELTPHQELRLTKTLMTHNTGITALEEHGGEWKLLTWNDHAHLG